jgi:hypothetical protein
MEPMPQPDDHDDLSALDFSSYQSGSGDNGHEDVAALDFSAADEGAEESDAEALGTYAPTEAEEADNELEAIAAATEAAEGDEEDEEDAYGFTVINPPETVSVTAQIDGSTQRVKLSATATKLTESELAEEIVVLAALAQQKGLAGQHSYLHSFLQDNNEVLTETIGEIEELKELGLDATVVGDLMDNFYPLPTPEQADAAQTEVFAARYTDK